MAPREQMRAADADREQYAEVVRRALDEGRLTLDEMDERLRQIYAAKTFGELEQAVADLPRATPAERSQLTVPRGAPSSPVPPSRQDPKAKLPGWLSVADLAAGGAGKPGDLVPGQPHHGGVDLLLADLGGRPLGSGQHRVDHSFPAPAAFLTVAAPLLRA